MRSGFRFLVLFAAVLAARVGTLADTVTMKDHVTYDGKVISNKDGLVRMQSGDRELCLPAADVEKVETNDKQGQAVNYAEVERLAAERDKELVAKTGLDVQDRDAVDAMLRDFFLMDEMTAKRARRALLDMAKTKNPYRYLEMQWRDFLPSKLSPLFEVMFELKPEGMREILKETVSSSSEATRATSLELLGRLKDRSALESMRRGLADEYPEVRIAAVHALSALGVREATPSLLEALKAGDPRVQNAARSALSTLWTEANQPSLEFSEFADWSKFWKAKAGEVPGAWDPKSIEPLVPPGTICLEH